MPFVSYHTSSRMLHGIFATQAQATADAEGIEGIDAFTGEITGANFPLDADLTYHVTEAGVVQKAPIFSAAELANRAFRSARGKFIFWGQDLYRFGWEVARVGNIYLAGGYQGLKIAFGDSTTYPHSLMVTMCNNAELGAADITSADDFADSAYANRSASAPTRAMLWLDKTTGARVNLDAMQDYGPLVDERPFLLPTTFRS